MCQLKSAIVLKDRVYLPDHDSHDKMLAELGIKDTKKNAETKFVRVELVPINGDIFAPVDNWRLNVDQDIRPDWFFEEVEKPNIIEAVKAWAKNHIFDGVDNLELKNSGTYYLRNCKNATLWGNSTATLWENSTATLWENSTATLWENSTATLCENSTATLRENSTATLWGNSTATLCENSTATLRGNSTGRIPDNMWGGKRESYVLMENSTLKDCTTNTIYQAGIWKYVEVIENV